MLEFRVHAPRFTFDKTLSMGMNDAQVKNLQIVLNYVPFTAIATTGVGASGNESIHFGPATKKALIAFQNIFADEILAPTGLTSGTGSVGAATRKELNVLCAN
jgi:peptidoglycan hydrolase-like protein with peptidoglycan-binding domain